jgi:hypothetical protein
VELNVCTRLHNLSSNSSDIVDFKDITRNALTEPPSYWPAFANAPATSDSSRYWNGFQTNLHFVRHATDRKFNNF